MADCFKRLLSRLDSNARHVVEQVIEFKCDNSSVQAFPEMVKECYEINAKQVCGLKSGIQASNKMERENYEIN